MPVIMSPYAVSSVPGSTAYANTLFDTVCAPAFVTTDAELVPAVLTRKSPVPTVRIPDVWVATQFPLAKSITAPEARKRSENDSAAVPSAALSLLVGAMSVMKRGEVCIATTVPEPVRVYSPNTPALSYRMQVVVPLFITVVPTVRLLGPAEPVAPVGPVLPVAPVAPVGPVGPSGPVAPVAPV